MKKLKSIVWVAAINLAVFLILVLTVNLVAAVGIDMRLDKMLKPDNRWELPNYPDKERAKTLFAEFKNLSSAYRPFVGWSRMEMRGITTTINSDGDRTSPPTTDKPDGVARFFGGSTMWGTGADDAGTIPALFNQQFPNLQVYNHGEAGFVSRQGLARLTNLAVVKTKMDLVVFYDGVNDTQIYCAWEMPLDSHGQAEEIRDRMIESRVKEMFFGNIEDSLMAMREKFRWFRFGTPARTGTRCEAEPDHARLVATAMIENWKIAQQIVTAQGGRFVAILQPVIYIGDPRSDHLKINMDSSQARMYRLVYAELKRQIAELNVDWIYDFTDAFDGDEFIYIDFCHVSANGNAIIAERLAKIVRSAPLGRQPGA